MLRLLVVLIALGTPAVATAQQPCTADPNRVVNEIYRAILERPADRSANTFVQRLANGQSTVRDIVRDVALSREHLQRFITIGDAEPQRREAATALYRHLLGRQPDAGGLQAHMEGLRREGAAAAIEVMLNSDEYRQSIGDSGVPGTQVRYCGGSRETSNRVAPRFRTMDSNGDGRIARREWQGTAWAFANADLNGDGVVTPDELSGNSRNGTVGTSGTVAEEPAARFDALDGNRNGRIERREWTGTAAEFDRLDRDRNNLLSRAEVTTGLMTGSSEFDQLDSNHDGRLTIQEWDWNRRSFDQQDVNRDGFLTRREFTGVPANNTGF